MLRASGHGHIGGTYSSIDMVTALYFYKMNVNPEKPDWEDRDRFLLSAGHKSMVQYAVLAEKGYFPKEYTPTEMQKIIVKLLENYQLKWQKEKELKKYDR